MNNKSEHAAIYYREKKAGILTKTNTGYVFNYAPKYLADPAAQPISLSMPLRDDSYESSRLFSFFDGLLPEGWLLNLITTTVKIDKNDKFRLLLHTGGDPIGAVSIRPVTGDQ